MAFKIWPLHFYNLDIFNNSSLQNIEGLSNINVFQELTITENESLQNLIGLGSITKVNIHIEIKGTIPLQI